VLVLGLRLGLRLGLGLGLGTSARLLKGIRVSVNMSHFLVVPIRLDAHDASIVDRRMCRTRLGDRYVPGWSTQLCSTTSGQSPCFALSRRGQPQHK